MAEMKEIKFNRHICLIPQASCKITLSIRHGGSQTLFYFWFPYSLKKPLNKHTHTHTLRHFCRFRPSSKTCWVKIFWSTSLSHKVLGGSCLVPQKTRFFRHGFEISTHSLHVWISGHQNGSVYHIERTSNQQEFKKRIVESKNKIMLY